MTQELVRAPTRIGSGLALLAAVLGAMVGVAFSGPSAVLAVTGMGVLIVGIVLPRPGIITTGAALVASAVFVAGYYGAPASAIMIGTIGAILAWDLAHNAISHGRQVGRDADTVRPELLHAAGSTGVGVVTAVLGYALYGAVTAGQPVTAVALLALASVLIVLAVK